MVTRGRLTYKTAQETQPGPDPIYLCDQRVKGLMLHILPGGTRTFYVRYRVRGTQENQRLQALGALGEISVLQARKMAQELVAIAAQGRDPLTQKKLPARKKTVKQTAEHYKTHALPKLSKDTQRGYRRILDHHVIPSIGNLLLSQVTPEEVRAVMWRATSPSSANNHRAVLGSLYTYALRKGWHEGPSPTTKVQARKTAPRHQPFTPSEVAAVWYELGKLEERRPLHVAAIKILMLTGARYNEIISLRWKEVKPRGRTIRKGTTKKGQSPAGWATNVIALCPWALEVLQALPRGAPADYIFPCSRWDGKLIDLRGVWQQALASAGVEKRNIQQLRHTVAYLLAGVGRDLNDIGTVLRHADHHSTEVYAHLVGTQQALHGVDGNEVVDQVIWGNLQAYGLLDAEGSAPTGFLAA